MNEPTFVRAAEVMEMLRIGKSAAYKVIKTLNEELKAQGYITFTGRVPRAYVIKRCIGGQNG